MSLRPTVVLLHAFPLDHRMWDGRRETLEAQGFPVVAPDFPGDALQSSLGAWAEDVLGLVEGPIVPVGVSMGGYLAFELWRRAPDRIAALVLADTRAGAETPESRAGRDETIALVRERGADGLWERVRERLFAPGAAADAVERARRIALEQPPAALVAAVEAIRDREDSRETLATITVPVLVVVGEEDALTPPAEAEAIARAVPHARLVRIPGSGHLSPLERPREFDGALLAFLGKLER